jgi:putative heme-binding domain-containing protein
MHALRNIATLKSAKAAEAAMTALDLPMDPTLDYALWLTMRELEPYWLPAFAKGEINFGNDPRKIAFAISASGSPEAVKPLVRLLDDPQLAKATRQELMLVLARIGGPDEQAFCLAKVAEGSLAASEQMAILKDVESAVRSRRIAAPKPNDLLAALLKNPHRPAAYSAMRLAGLWKVTAIRPAIESVAISDNPLAERLAAVEAIALYGDEPAKALLTKLASDAEKTATAQAALIGLIGLDPAKAAPLAVKQLMESRDGDAPAEITAAYVARRGGGQALANALKGTTLPADAAKAALARLRTSGANEPALVAVLRAAGKLDAVAAYPAEAEIKRLAGEAMARGDASRGEKIYRRSELQCLKCHAIGGAGGQVGPDMTSLGASAQPDYIVEALLNPNAKVKEGYNAIRIVTADGKQHQGIRQREADGKVVLRNAEDKEIAINLNEIEEKADARSLMPDGLTQPLTTQELLDLTKFLSELGKIGPYAPNPTPMLRVWEAVESTGTNSERMRRTRATIAAETDNGLTWIPKVAMVSGMLPLDELPRYRVWNNANEQSFIRTAIDVTQPGAVRLAFNDPAGLTLFVNGQPIELKEKTGVTLPVGRSNVVLLVDRGRRTTDVKVELLDEPGSPARAKPVLR